MAKPPRQKTAQGIETSILLSSARRCPVCFQLYGDLAVKVGQIAHLDGDRTNGEEDNLAWMCMPHHSEYDSTTSQHKNFTIGEVKMMRTRLYDAIARNEHTTGAPPQAVGGRQADLRTLNAITGQMTQADTLEVLHRHHFGDPFATAVLDVIGGFRYQTGAGYEFIDQELEQKRVTFLGACSTFSDDAGRYTFAWNNSPMRRVPTEWHNENRDFYDKVVRALDNKATALYEAYNDLVRFARLKLES